MKKFEEEIINLKRQLLEMAASVEEMITKSVNALKERNMILAEEVIRSDDKVNKMEVEIDNLGIKILALYQPEAEDLRAVTMIMKINNDLERIGDHAVIAYIQHQILQAVVELYESGLGKGLVA